MDRWINYTYIGSDYDDDNNINTHHNNDISSDFSPRFTVVAETNDTSNNNNNNLLLQGATPTDDVITSSLSLTTAVDCYWPALLLFGLVVAGVIGNGLVCCAVAVERKLRNVTNYFLVSLSVADLLVSLVVMPCCIAQDFVGHWPFGLVLCDIWQVADVTLCTSSIMHMCTISLDRYSALRRPLESRLRRSTSTVWTRIAFVWIVSFLIASPLIVLGVLRPDDLLSADGQCAIFNAEFLVYGSLLAFFAPLVVMLVTYALTIRLLRRRADEAERRSRDGTLRRSTSQQRRHRRTGATYRMLRYAPVTSIQPVERGGGDVGADGMNSTSGGNGHASHHHHHQPQQPDTSASTALLEQCDVTKTATMTTTTTTGRPSSAVYQTFCQLNDSRPQRHTDSCVDPNATGPADDSPDSLRSATGRRHGPARRASMSAYRSVVAAGGLLSSLAVGGGRRASLRRRLLTEMSVLNADGSCASGSGAGGTGSDTDSDLAVDAAVGSAPSTYSPFQTTLTSKHRAVIRLAGLLALPGGTSSTPSVSLQPSFSSGNAGGGGTAVSVVRTERKAVKVVGMMFAMFVACWASFFAVNLAMGICRSCHFDERLFKSLLWLGYASSTVNPIIYTIFNQSFKRTFVRILTWNGRCCCCCCCCWCSCLANDEQTDRVITNSV